MVNLNHLRIFYYAAKFQNFTQAAAKLCISQPGVTIQIKAFEEELEVKLFIKRGRKVYLTDEGVTLYKYAKKILEAEKEFIYNVENLQTLKKGILRLGTAKIYGRYLLPFILSDFLNNYPSIQIKVDEGSSEDLVNNLLELKNEIIIISKTEETKGVDFITFFRTEAVLILSQNHPLTCKEKVSFSDLIDEKIIMKETGSATRKLVDDMFRRHRCTPNILMETSNSEFIKQMVKQGKGISFLAKEWVQEDISEKILATRPLEKDKIFMDAHFAYRSNQHHSAAAKAFVGYLEKLKSKESPVIDIGDLIKKITAGHKS